MHTHTLNINFIKWWCGFCWVAMISHSVWWSGYSAWDYLDYITYIYIYISERCHKGVVYIYIYIYISHLSVEHWKMPKESPSWGSFCLFFIIIHWGILAYYSTRTFLVLWVPINVLCSWVFTWASRGTLHFSSPGKQADTGVTNLRLLVIYIRFSPRKPPLLVYHLLSFEDTCDSLLSICNMQITLLFSTINLWQICCDCLDLY